MEASMTCPHCGAPDPGTVTFEGLVAHREPFRVNYRGRRLDLTLRQAEMLYKLIRFGRASFESLQGDQAFKSMQSAVHGLRRQLPEGFFIRSIHGWGYELAQDERASTATVKDYGPIMALEKWPG
jgi:DNA-binding response OmpR family regulator